ncbi:Gfo/Idh/MocA family oxidoreductase [Candidatus Calescamantes bacterium]|nr:Gfo/Idh/MocA family oxidoreductase [Candidatus Calescamantes bacterium]
MKLGIIGTGANGRGHIQVISLFKNINIVALCDPNRNSLSKAEEVLREKGLYSPSIKKFRNYEELLKIEEIDAVLISTPNYTHKEITIASLEAGKHVLCEKPMATNAKECQEIIKAQKRAGKALQIGLEYRHAPIYQKMKQLIQKGEVGKPWVLWCKEFRGPFAKKVEDWILQRDKSGGSLVEKDCHHFDLFNWFAKSRPLRVSGFGGNEVIYQKRDILDHAWVIVEYENGARACLGLCFFSPYGNDILEVGIIGDKGKIESYQNTMEIILWKRSKPLKKVFPIYISPKIGETSHNGSMYYQWKHFLKVVEGEAEPFPGGEIGLWSVAVPEAAEKAIEEKRIVEVKEVLNA